MQTDVLAIAAISLSIWAIVRLILQKREPAGTLSWLLFILFVPIVGPLLYFCFGPQQIERKASKRRARIFKAREEKGKRPAIELEWLEPLSEWPSPDREVFQLAESISQFPPTDHNDLQLLSDPFSTLEEMKKAISQAKKRIHLEYYIVASDEVTRELFDQLILAAKRGVEVRLLYDSLGSLSLKGFLLRKLAKHGVETAAFLPFSISNFLQRVNPNFRNHRKILVIDGSTAFTGGVNIGREYLGRRTSEQWRDFAVLVKGPSCRQLDEVFRDDWEFTTGRLLPELPAVSAAPIRLSQSEWVQVLESGPDTAFQTLHQTLFLGITSAQREILLTTPYFIPDTAIATALAVSALKGVRVRLLLPSKTDVFFVRKAGRSFYDLLLEAGVEIFEYQPKILHSKLMLIDNRWAVVGSANMDIRSFRLNFELNLMVHGARFAKQIRAMFDSDLAQSRKVEPTEFWQRSVLERFAENSCRLLSPLL